MITASDIIPIIVPLEALGLAPYVIQLQQRRIHPYGRYLKNVALRGRRTFSRRLASLAEQSPE